MALADYYKVGLISVMLPQCTCTLSHTQEGPCPRHDFLLEFRKHEVWQLYAAQSKYDLHKRF